MSHPVAVRPAMPLLLFPERDDMIGRDEAGCGPIQAKRQRTDAASSLRHAPAELVRSGLKRRDRALLAARRRGADLMLASLS